jgi:hypothetical protein
MHILVWKICGSSLTRTPITDLTNMMNKLTFKNKRLALDMLQVQVVVDGDEISLSGAIPIGGVASALTY